MPIVPVDSAHPDPTIIADAAARLRRGELVAFPTETVYGLGANALDAEAVARIYAAKGRPAWNPVIAHVPDVTAARALARSWPASAERLAAACWPGPVTLVVPKAAHVPNVATAGLDAIGIRVPAHPVALALLRAAAIPIAAPSANRFTQVSPTTAAHVVRSLGDRVPLVLDGGPCAVGIESTVVDCTGDDVVILRPGMLGRDTFEAALAGTGIIVRYAARQAIAHDAGDAAVAGEANAGAANAGAANAGASDSGASDARTSDAPRIEPPRSPGMADRHYAPRGEVWLFTPEQQAEIAQALAERAARGEPGVVMAILRTVALEHGVSHAVRLPADATNYARAIYGALHEADAREAALVLIELPPEDDHAWDAVRDRLTRAGR